MSTFSGTNRYFFRGQFLPVLILFLTLAGCAQAAIPLSSPARELQPASATHPVRATTATEPIKVLNPAPEEMPDSLADAPATEVPVATPAISLLMPQFGWLPQVGVEVRVPGALRFSAASTGVDIPESTLIRFFRRTRDGNPATPARILLPPDGAPLDFFPGAVFHLQALQIAPRLGRFRLVAPKATDMQILTPSGAVAHLTSGEASFEIDAEGAGVFALPRGAGWMKDIKRKTIKLSAGRQVGFTPIGTLEKPRDIDSRWKETAYQGFAPFPDPNRPPASGMVPDSVKEALAALEEGEEEDEESGGTLRPVDETSSDPAPLPGPLPQDIQAQLASTARELGLQARQGNAASSPPSLLPASLPAQLAAPVTGSVPVAFAAKQELPKVSSSLLSYMSPEARALMSATAPAAPVSPASGGGRIPEQILPPPLPGSRSSPPTSGGFSLPGNLPFQLPGSLNQKSAQDLLKNLQGGTMPLPPITWKYIFLPGFSPVPIPVPVPTLPPFLNGLKEIIAK